MKRRLGIEVRGIVQGVGFRPYVYRLARANGLTGTIRNSAAGVSIEVEGSDPAVTRFFEGLPREAPPLAQLHEIRTFDLAAIDDTSFLILESLGASHADTLISPDIATCSDCMAELFDPNDRRFGYPFLNCTNCGPRFTITHRVPYDRSSTSMARFKMCALCQAEYDDPGDRRFHAQPNACWQCGPQLDLVDARGVEVQGDPVANAVRLLLEGHVLAVKGVGGFHLAVDARQPKAVAELRKRKNRGEKPFALMVAKLEAAAHLCEISAEAAKLLTSPQRPIVLVPKLTADFDSLAPDGNELGIFLPYTPLHHLLLASIELTAIVMTSANRSDEPIAIDNEEALARLGNIADFFVLHNRDILLRCDDSVMRASPGGSHFVRRSRGFVPLPIRLKRHVPPILAVGGELKNAICLSRGEYAFPGQHIGDLEDISAYDFFEESITHFQKILEVKPEAIAHDLHPGYLSTQWAKRQPTIPLIGVQHHHAHIASCMVEHQLEGTVIGIALDGTGYGIDGQVWGGEVLVADLQHFERAAHLEYAPMLSGDSVIREPWRMAVSYLWQAFGADWRNHLPQSTVEAFPQRGVAFLEQLLEKKSPTILTSSCGRLFDAVAALTCNRMTVSYEAQAAVALQACGEPFADVGEYPFSIFGEEILQIGTQPLFSAIAEDLRNRVNPGMISRRFHDGFAAVLTEVALRTAERTHLREVCLSGGSFQNSILLLELTRRLERSGMQVFAQSKMPPGDGGLSLGQLMIASNNL